MLRSSCATTYATIILSLTVSVVGCGSASAVRCNSSAAQYVYRPPAPPSIRDYQLDRESAGTEMVAAGEDLAEPDALQLVAGESNIAPATEPVSMNDRIQFHTAMALAESGHYDKSLSRFTGLVGPAVACCNLGVICYEQGDFGRSRGYFQQAQESNADLPEARVWLRWVQIQEQSASREIPNAQSQSKR